MGIADPAISIYSACSLNCFTTAHLVVSKIFESLRHQDLSKHLSTDHSDMDMEAFCALCDGSVPPSSFVDHVSECKQKKRKEARQKGADGVRAVCDLCGKSLCNQSALKTHKFQVHTKYSPFKCDLCDYRAKTRTIIKM
jgi:uncharacterized Zn-finger protein